LTLQIRRDVSAIQNLLNPYDFANPVSDSSLFIGRVDELSEIRYYLEQALRSKRPTNIAIVGSRASGKTSLLNISEQEAKKLGLLSVRIDLDEGDALSQWAFFFKIFDTLLSAACEAGAYGGKHGRTLETYVDVTCSLSIPEDKTFCPFFFPIQYAKALSGNNSQGQVPDYSFRQDLSAIQTEVKKPIVLLFDEGNVLSKSRVHLQKLRNIFMNAQGYMLIVTGTPEMFPLMDEVFSPIIRQFKKVVLNQFVDQDDTGSLIRKYLETVGVQPDSLFDFEGSNDLEDIHDLTGGRPYEIQLVCHTLFKRVQQGRASTMSLDLGVIEEVRQQLESSQNLAGRPILNKIKTLDFDSLRALGVISPCVGGASFEQLSALESLLGLSEWSQEEFASKFAYLKSEGILDESERGVITFKGDDFDKIYTKYFSVEKEAPVQFSEFSFAAYTRIRLDAFVQAAAAVRSPRPMQPAPRAIDIRSVVDAMGTAGGPTNVFVETPIALLRSIYRLLFDYQGASEIVLVECGLNLAGAEVQAWYVPRRRGNREALEVCLSTLQVVRTRAEAMGHVCVFQLIDIPVPSLEDVLNRIATSGNRKLGELLADSHANTVFDGYVSQRITTTVERHAAAAYSLREFLSPIPLNNLGYFFSARDDLSKALMLFQLSIEAHVKSEEPHALPSFNMAILHAKNGDAALAVGLLGQIVGSLIDPDEKIACLFVPKKVGSAVEFLEIRDRLSLSEEISSALRILTTENHAENDPSAE
jgi:hypothetical protein